MKKETLDKKLKNRLEKIFENLPNIQVEVSLTPMLVNGESSNEYLAYMVYFMDKFDPTKHSHPTFYSLDDLLKDYGNEKELESSEFKIRMK